LQKIGTVFCIPECSASLSSRRKVEREAASLQTGRKLVDANFANILIAILAPTARRLMCDISPCGGGYEDFLWDGWDAGAETVCAIGAA
jgi:hypothetical protein